MAKSLGKKTGSFIVWIILALLILGLAGFGVGNFGGSVQSIGKVGDTEINVDTYARALQQELRAQATADGGASTFSELESRGIVARVRARVIADTAFDDEANKLGVSIGDERLREEIIAIDAFQGPDGEFDREAYRFALERNGMSETQFEERLRADSARGLVQGAVAGGTVAPASFIDTLLGYVAERRSYAEIALGPDDLATPLPSPGDATLRAYHTENEADFTAPETRRLTYAWITPDMLIDSVEVDEDLLRALYEERRDAYVLPERRLVERLVFESAAEAQSAADRIAAGETDFETLVEARGLELGDIDLGDVTEADLGDAGPAVFALAEPGIAGPVQTDLGPALFRVNAVLAAQETTFEEARDELREAAAFDRTRRLIADMSGDFDDRLAAGATLEDLAGETEMELGKIAVAPGTDTGIAAYAAFREAAAAVTRDDFPELVELDDGGVFALRLDEVVPPRLRPFEEVRDEVEAAWAAEETASRLIARAEALIARLEAGETIDDLGLPVTRHEGLTRNAVTPPALAEALFALDGPGAAAAVPAGAGAVLVVLEEIAPPDPEDPAVALLARSLQSQTAQGMAQDLYGYFGQALIDEAGLTLDQAAINAVHANFR
ncbi:peptidyl-prolyl cis-trans isomerase D [Rhodovulum iodosum]|uniref:Parvulin-like PPIase n=1 Tax=Rhodovulum iodosum TaxID=68291 RepID=A0ABV3XNX3_9RHOB|nr:peptidyl-prolyl cis-trans isomerase [Rhodovulum robiginosum]RSK35875.1 peptidylprolyl isomerase [Rhodovulum robiginosum]